MMTVADEGSDRPVGLSAGEPSPPSAPHRPSAASPPAAPSTIDPAMTTYTPAQENALIRMLRDIRDGHLRAYVVSAYNPMTGEQVPRAEIQIRCDRTLAGAAPERWWMPMLNRGWVAIHMTGGSAYLRCELPGSDALEAAGW